MLQQWFETELVQEGRNKRWSEAMLGKQGLGLWPQRDLGER